MHKHKTYSPVATADCRIHHYVHINIFTYSGTTGTSAFTGTDKTGVIGGAGSIDPGGNVKFNLFLDMV
jgi:hypothetical protein